MHCHVTTSNLEHSAEDDLHIPSNKATIRREIQNMNNTIFPTFEASQDTDNGTVTESTINDANDNTGGEMTIESSKPGSRNHGAVFNITWDNIYLSNRNRAIDVGCIGASMEAAEASLFCGNLELSFYIGRQEGQETESDSGCIKLAIYRNITEEASSTQLDSRPFTAIFSPSIGLIGTERRSLLSLAL